MGLYAEFDIVEDFGYPYETFAEGIIVDYSEGISVFMDTFMEVIEELVPIDTGYLFKHITAEQIDETICAVEADCDYAQYVEYGTWCMEAQSYFEPALEEALIEAEPYWKKALAEARNEESEILYRQEVQSIKEAYQYTQRMYGQMKSEISAMTASDFGFTHTNHERFGGIKVRGGGMMSVSSYISKRKSSMIASVNRALRRAAKRYQEDLSEARRDYNDMIEKTNFSEQDRTLPRERPVMFVGQILFMPEVIIT